MFVEMGGEEETDNYAAPPPPHVWFATRATAGDPEESMSLQVFSNNASGSRKWMQVTQGAPSVLVISAASF